MCVCVCLCQYNDIYTYVWMKAGLHNRTDRAYTKEIVNTNASVIQNCVIPLISACDLSRNIQAPADTEQTVYVDKLTAQRNECYLAGVITFV